METKLGLAILPGRTPEQVIRDYVNVGHVIRAARTYRSLTQAELARMAKVDKGSLSKVEKGYYDEVSDEALDRLGKVVGLTQQEVHDLYMWSRA